MLVCAGLAKKHGLRVTGKRNAFCTWLGERPEEWRSGTTPGLAVHFRSNSHTAPNHRVPLLSCLHEADCPSAKCREALAKYDTRSGRKVLTRLIQRVQREVTGYYCGYTFKGQCIGRKHMKRASTSLDYVTADLAQKSAGQRMHYVTNRMFRDMHHTCAARPAPEEYNLSAYWDERDVTNAEFQRTYMSISFPGGQLVQRLEDEMHRRKERVVVKLMPKKKNITDEEHGENLVIKHMPDLYGYRGCLPSYKDVYYLSAWEFMTLWEIKR